MKMNSKQKKAYNRLVKWGDWKATQIRGISGATQSPIAFFGDGHDMDFDLPPTDTMKAEFNKIQKRKSKRKDNLIHKTRSVMQNGNVVKIRDDRKSFADATETRSSIRMVPEYWPHRMESEMDIWINRLNSELKAFAQCVFEFKKITIYNANGSYNVDLERINRKRLILLCRFISQQKHIKFQHVAA